MNIIHELTQLHNQFLQYELAKNVLIFVICVLCCIILLSFIFMVRKSIEEELGKSGVHGFYCIVMLIFGIALSHKLWDIYTIKNYPRVYVMKYFLQEVQKTKK